MRVKPLIAFGVLGMAIGFAAGSGCQSYDVNPVVPKAIELQDKPTTVSGHSLSPNVMLVVDRSGSMTDPGDASGASCADQNGCYTGQSGGDCKWNELLNVFVNGSNGNAPFIEQLDALGTAGNPVQLGLTYFSGDMAACTQATIADACSTGVVAVAVQSDAGSTIEQVLSGLTPGGGTPTAATLAMLPSAFPPPDPTLKVQRANYVILLTDGAPNCDAQFSPTATNCSGDRCTEDTAMNQCPTWDNSCPCWFSGAPVPQTCLDEQATITQITNLNTQNNIQTFVIGFGVENNGGSVAAAVEVLNEAAVAGGFPFDGGFYPASNEMDLQSALSAIVSQISQPCTFSLDSPPPSQELIEVLVTPSGGSTTQLTQSQFSFSASTDQVTITDTATCNEIKSSTPNNPVAVDFKYLTSA